MNKVTSYLKNVGKSMAYATVDVASKRMIPEVKDFIDTNQDVFKSVYATVSHSKKSMNYGKKLAVESQLYKDLNKGFKNAVDDIKSGNFYNKAREDTETDAFAESMFGFDDDDFNFDFDFNEDDGSLDNFQDKEQPVKEAPVTKGDMVVANSVNRSSNLAAQLISSTVAKTNNVIAKTQISTTNMIMAQNVELMAGLRTSIAGMHESINGILKFAHEDIKTQINNESKYFETTTSIMQENNAILKEMLEMQRNLYNAKDTDSKDNDKFDKVFSGGTLDIKEYLKAITSNLKSLDKTGTVSMLTTDMGGSTIIGQMMSNPLGFVMTSLVEKFIPINLAKTMGKFSKTLGNLFPAMVSKLNDWKKNNGGILGIFGDIFGIDVDTKSKIDTSKYKKDAVPFDGITRKAIVDVIPEHLSRIESLLAGGTPQRIYDYHKGKWISAKDIEKQQQNEYEYLIKDSFSELSSVMTDLKDELKARNVLTDEKSQKTFDEDMMKMMTKVFENGGHFSPENIKKNIKSYKFNKEDTMETVMDVLSSLSPGQLAEIAASTMKNRSRLAKARREAELQGDSVQRKLYDRSYDDYGYSNSQSSKGTKSSSSKSSIGSLNNYNYNSKNENRSRALSEAAKATRLKADKREDEDYDGFGKFINKHKSMVDDIPGDTFVQKFQNANNMQTRFALIMSSLNDIAKKPAALLTGLIAKADQSIYNLLFKAPTDEYDSEGNKIKGLFNKMLDNMKNKWAELTKALDEKVIKPLADKYELGDKWSKLKNRAKEGLLGKVQKDDKGNIIKNEYGFAKRSEGLFTPTMYALQKDYRGIAGYTKDSISEVLSPILDDPTMMDFRNSLNNKKHRFSRKGIAKKLQNIIDNLPPEEKKKLTKEAIEKLTRLGVTGLAKGGKVTKAGLIAVSEGEEVTVKNKNKNPKDIRNNQIGESNRTLNAVYDALLNPNADMSKHEAQFGIPGFAEGGTAENDGKKYTIDDIDKLLKSLDDIDNKYGQAVKNNKDKRRSGGPITDVFNYIKHIFGMDDPNKEKGKINKMLHNVMEDFNPGTGSDIASKAIIGGGLGLLSGIAAGPLLGAGIGAAVALTNNSKTISRFLFGKEITDENGNITDREDGGLISKKTQDVFKKYLPDVGKYGVTGMAASLVLPFGPLAGAVMGAGVGLAKNSETMNSILFGDEDGLFNKDRRDKIKDYFPKAAAGAVAGLFLGPFGIMGNSVLGAGVGMLTNTEEFKNLILGEPGPNGSRFGGLKGALDEHFVAPLREFGANFKEDFFGFIKESMVEPLNRAITPIASEIAFQTKRVVFGIPKMFAKLGKEYIAQPFMSKITDYFISPLGDLTQKLFGGTLNRVKGLVSAPFRFVGGVGDRIRKHQIREGRDVSGLAKDRVQFAQEHKMGDYNYKKFDTYLSDNSNDENALKELTARTGMLAHGAEYFEKQVKATGKELSKVIDDYVKLGWMSKNKKAYKRIKNFIKNNDVDSAIQELANIQKSRTDGGKMSDENADEAIRRFTDANKQYQATKQARQEFGDINQKENVEWMRQNFGNNWNKLMDADKLFKYSTKELANTQKGNENAKTITKENLMDNLENLKTKGEAEINETLLQILDTVKNAKNRTFSSEDDSKKYDEEAASGTKKAKAQRQKQRRNVQNTLAKKGLDYGDDNENIISLLYSNEGIYQLVLTTMAKGNFYDAETIKKLCDLKLNETQISLLKKYPYVAGLPAKVLKKYLNKYRNDHGTMFGHKKVTNKNLDQLNKAMEAGINIDSSSKAQKLTSGNKNKKYDHNLRNEYFTRFEQLGLLNKTVMLGDKEIVLTEDLIIDTKKGLSYEDMNKIIKSTGGQADIKNDRTSVSSAVSNFSSKHLGFAKKGVGMAAGAAGIAGLTALSAPILVPLGALGVGALGIAGGAKLASGVAGNLRDLKALGIKGFINDKRNKSQVNSDLNDRDISNMAEDTNQSMTDDTANGVISGAKSKIKAFFTENGVMNYIKNKRGDWTLSKDSTTKETLEKNNEEENNQSKIISSLNTMKDGILGIFSRHKKKDEEDEKEPWYKKLFSFDLSSIGGKFKFGALALAGLTGIGAIKSMWDNREPGGLIDTIGSKVGDFVGPYVEKVINWFTAEDEYTGGGLPNFMEEHVYPNLFKGFNVVFQQVLPALIKSLIISFPKIIKAGIDGIGSLLAGFFGIGDGNQNDGDNEISADSVKAGGKSVKAAGGAGSGWLKEIQTDAATISSEMTDMANVVNTGKETITQRNLAELSNPETIGDTGADTSQTSNNKTDSSDNKSKNESKNPANIIKEEASKGKVNAPISQEHNVDPNEPLTYGTTGFQGYKKDENGNLIPLTVQDLIDNGGPLPEIYTETGVKYTLDEKGVYQSEKGDTFTMSDGLVTRLTKVFGRSFLTGRQMGAAKIATKIAKFTSGSLLGKAAKLPFKGADYIMKHIPFIKTPYKIGKKAITTTGKLAGNISKAGAYGHEYLSYFSEGLKNGYKPSELLSDIGGDMKDQVLTKATNTKNKVIDKAKNSKAGKVIDKAKNSKAGQVISETASKVKDKALDSKTGKKIAEITTKGKEAAKHAKGAVDKVVKWVKDCLDYILNKTPVFGKVKEALKKSGKEATEKATKNVIKEMIEKLMKKFTGNVVGKFAQKAMTKLVAAIGSGGLMTLAFSIVDFTVGFDQAESILGIEDVSFVQRLLAGLINIITNEVFFGLIDASTIVDWCVDIIFPMFSIDVKDFKNDRAKAEQARLAWNEKTGEDLSTEEYLKKDKLTWKVTKTWDNTKKAVGDAWDGAKNWVGEQGKAIKEKGVLGWAGDGLKGLFGFGDKDEKKPAKNSDVDKDSKKSKGASMAKLLSPFAEVMKQTLPNPEEIMKNSATITDTTAQAGNFNIAEQQANEFDVISQNIKSAFSITDIQLGKAYGFKDSKGNFIPLSKGIESFKKNSKDKGLVTFADVLNNINANMTNMNNSIGTTPSTTSNSSKGTGLFGAIGGTALSAINSLFGGKGSGKGFVSQLDPKYKNQKFNKPGDSQSQYIGDSGCAPATAANVLNLYSGRGRDEMVSASEAALRYKETNGGVTPDYFQNYLGKKGIGTYPTYNKSEMLSSIKSGQPTILLGEDPTNKTNSPYGSASSHYVLATGMDKRGNVIVQDPESRRPNSLYPAKNVINQSHFGMITGRGSGAAGRALLVGATSLNLSKVANQTGDLKDQDLAAWSPLTDEEIDNFIKSYRGSNTPFTGALINKAAAASGLDPRYLLAHAAVESAWGTSNQGKTLHNYFGIGAYDSDPGHARNYSNPNLEAGLVNGAVWIRESYYNKGQKTVYTMRHNNGKHEYCTSNTWVDTITKIMSKMPTNTNAQFHEPDPNAAVATSGSNAASTLFGMLEALPEAYFGKELMSLFGFNSSSSSSGSSGSDLPGSSSPNVENAVKQMEAWANDPNVGYDQDYRWGERGDYDCSGAVITAFEKNGIKVKSNGASYTGDMLGAFEKTGFKDITSSINLESGDGLARGDVLLTPNKHTAIYSGDGKEVEASINEHGKAKGGTPGDQTGKEFLINNYRNHPWKHVLRYAGSGTGSKKRKSSNFLNTDIYSGRGSNNLTTSILNSTSQIKQSTLPNINSQNPKRISSYLPSLSYDSGSIATNSLSNNTSSNISSSNTDRLLGVIIEVLKIIANNSEKLSEIVNLLSKALDLNLTDNDISKLSSNNAQIKNKLAKALQSQGSANGLGNSVMSASTESLATAMYSIARA